MKTGICIIGAGPAGLMAAVYVARTGVPTTVVEANTRAGRKLLLTGGGRCNFTHVGGAEEIAQAFGKAGRFLRYSLHELPPRDVMEFFSARGLKSVVEADGCVFPASNKATDVLDILVRETKTLGIQALSGTPATKVQVRDAGFVVHTKEQQILATCVIIATGGVTWPQTGSTGDGYRFAAELGHTIIPSKPSLVPLVTRERWVGDLAGISLPQVKMQTTVGKRRLTVTGAMLFTQNGIGGPAVLDLSWLVADELYEGKRDVVVRIDMAPQLDEPGLDRQLQESVHAHPRRAVANVLTEFVPRQLSRVVCDLAQCDCDLQVGQLKAEARRRLVTSVKGLPLTVTGTEAIEKATVTRGGVSTKEIEPQTMESQIRPGLFFAGEVIDVDGPCGGYNLQMCWSTGALAGHSATHAMLSASQPTS
jgi:predicted Rossmann fold flavoprotein